MPSIMQSITIASFAVLVAAQGDLSESKFAKAPAKSSCYDIQGYNGYYCNAQSQLMRCTTGSPGSAPSEEFCQQCGLNGCTADVNGYSGYCYQGGQGTNNC
ncbi:hypothetical protein Slin15195_G108650 [Septoria linicola]|uniref:Uncharacterized protein n=1 Tax=Septoria linicola TaxID=215465 RepID=A0A9Q9B5J4_9PEZI|nr:hypothetical protein Slin14017_G106950 [Septoria linicola]USW57546.1 hypothetical protein Slin15195_G108650 [Septoria linicola]